MSRKLFIYCIAFLAVITSVLAAPSLNIAEDSIQASLAQGQEKVIPITIFNTGTDPLTLKFDTAQLDLTDRNDDQISIRFEPAQPTIQPDGNITVQIIFKPDNTISFEKFGGILRVYDATTTTVQDTVTVDLDVQPDVCEAGVVGSDLKVDIKDPSSSKDFKPGDEIPIKVKVYNNGKNSIRVQTEAFLFSKSRNIKDTASETRTIDADDDYTFTMSIVIPSDSDNVKKDEDLKLVVKGFDDENERRNCALDTTVLNIKLKTKDVNIDTKTSRVFPEIAACGDTVKGSILVQNVGSDDLNNVKISLTSKELGISLKSDGFSLDRFENGDDSKATRQFDIKIPATAQEKSYPMTARVEFPGGSEDVVLPFQVASCQGKKRVDTIATVLVRPLEEQMTLSQGAIRTVPIQITNLLNSRATYTITIKDIDEIGQAGTKIIALNPGQITTTFIDITVKDDAEPGLYSGSILVKQAGQTIGSQTLVVEVKQAQKPASTNIFAIQSMPLFVWVILVILAIGGVIIAIMATIKYLKRQKVMKP